MSKYTRNKIKEEKKKADIYTPPGVIPAEDMPQIGDLWKLTTFYGTEGTVIYHYLIVDHQYDDFDQPYDLSFHMLELETGEKLFLYMNFELDDWRKVA